MSKPRLTKRLEGIALTAGLKFLVLLLKLLPFEAACWFSALLAKAAFILVPAERRKAIAHLGIAFPRLKWSERKRIAKR
ncbi:MAG TPA: hypothetical protein ENF73_02795, partial [Proteobacteria bacterium]|nr:hypothetical protein [Pseudomonadota bacterium]